MNNNTAHADTLAHTLQRIETLSRLWHAATFWHTHSIYRRCVHVNWTKVFSSANFHAHWLLLPGMSQHSWQLWVGSICLGWFDFKTQFYKLWLNFGFWITLNAKWELNVVFPKAQDTVCTHRPMKCGGFGELSEDWAGKGFPSVFVVYTVCMYNCISINYILSSLYL